MPRGGYRPGSGRPKGSGSGRNTIVPVAPVGAPAQAHATLLAIGDKTPLKYLLDVMNDPDADDLRRDRAAGIAAAFVHAKAGEVGKKGERQQAADRAGKGKFAPAAPPRLVINNK